LDEQLGRSQQGAASAYQEGVPASSSLSDSSQQGGDTEDASQRSAETPVGESGTRGGRPPARREADELSDEAASLLAQRVGDYIRRENLAAAKVLALNLLNKARQEKWRQKAREHLRRISALEQQLAERARWVDVRLQVARNFRINGMPEKAREVMGEILRCYPTYARQREDVRKELRRLGME
jgi:thioredoxin-like negative regulator of GroEL